MLSCQTTCPTYQIGCHKTCTRWKAFQSDQRQKRQAQKRYLDFYNQICSQQSRQLRELQVRRVMW